MLIINRTILEDALNSRPTSADSTNKTNVNSIYESSANSLSQLSGSPITKTPSTPSPAPVQTIEQYRKTAHENLININNNLSGMLKDSFAEIDSLCHKVRLCVLDANTIKKTTLGININRQELIQAEHVKETVDLTLLENERKENLICLKPSTGSVQVVALNKNQKLHGCATSVKNKHSKPLTHNNESMPNVELASTETIKQINQINDYDHLEMEQFLNDEQIDKKQQNKIKKQSKLEVIQSNISFGIRDSEELIDNRQHCQTLTYENDVQLDLGSNEYKRKISQKYITPIGVYRKRAHTNIHQRLEDQLDANDSFVCFQKLMSRGRNQGVSMLRNVAARTAIRKAACGRHLPYWSRVKSKCVEVLFPLAAKRRAAKRKTQFLTRNNLWCKGTPAPAQKTKKKLKKRKKSKSPTIVNKSRKFLTSSSNNNRSPNNKCQMIETNEKQPSYKQYLLRTTDSSNRLDHFDIVDDITINDIRPLTSEYPRKDQMTIPIPTNWYGLDEITNSYLYQLTAGKNKEIHNAWHELFEPGIKCSSTDCRSCRKPFKKTLKRNIARKLSQYIFDSDQIHDTTLTMMPIRVSYKDKSKMDKQSSSQNASPKNKAAIVPKRPLTDPKRKLKNKTPSKYTGSPIPVIKSTNVKPPAPKTLTKISPLKRKNVQIENNIQKVIDSVEEKIIKILSKSEESMNCEMFSEMEKQISDVLKMMGIRENNKKISLSPQFPSVSDQLNEPLPAQSHEITEMDVEEIKVEKISPEHSKTLDGTRSSHTSLSDNTNIEELQKSTASVHEQLKETKNEQAKEATANDNMKAIDDSLFTISETMNLCKNEDETLPQLITEESKIIMDIKQSSSVSLATEINKIEPSNSDVNKTEQSDERLVNDDRVDIDEQLINQVVEEENEEKSVERIEIHIVYEMSLNYQQAIVIDEGNLAESSMTEQTSNDENFTPQISLLEKECGDQQACILSPEQKMNGKEQKVEDEKDNVVKLGDFTQQKYYRNINNIIEEVGKVYEELERFEKEVSIFNDILPQLMNTSFTLSQADSNNYTESRKGSNNILNDIEFLMNYSDDQIDNILNFMDDFDNFDVL